MAGHRFKRFTLERSYYYETHDAEQNILPDALTVEEWKEKVTSEWLADLGQGLEDVEEVLIAFHDDDYDEYKKLKPFHGHAVVKMKEPLTINEAMEKFGVTLKKCCEKVKTFSGAVRYLCHATDDAIEAGKTIYSETIIKGYALDNKGKRVELDRFQIKDRMQRTTEKRKKKDEQENEKAKLLNDVRKGKILPFDVCDMYENLEIPVTEYYKDKSMYKQAEQDYLERCYRFYQSHPHPSTLIYITGAGGSGKTTLANAIAESMADIRGIHSVSVPGRSTTFDFAGKYSGQKVSVFNEVSPDAFPIEQFLDVFDPLRASVVNSRNSDKPYFAECAIFTASMPFEKFLYEMWKPYAKANSNLPMAVRRALSVGSTESDWHNAYITCGGADIGNKMTQLRRRFAICIDIKQNSTLEIRIFQKTVNPAYSLLYTSSAFPACVPFTLFNTLPFDARLDEDTFSMLIDKAVKQTQKAIKAYYAQNGFKSPEKYVRPFETVGKEKEESKTDELSEFIDIMRVSEE